MMRFIALCVLLLATPAQADYAAAERAFERGDYATAYKEIVPDAERGDMRAQFGLGVLYAEGAGVPRDYDKALHWWRLAAAQGNAEAHYNIGTLYDYQAEPRQLSYAYMWYHIAASLGFDGARQELRKLAKEMKKDAIAEAEHFAKECVRNKYQGC